MIVHACLMTAIHPSCLLACHFHQVSGCLTGKFSPPYTMRHAWQACLSGMPDSVWPALYYSSSDHAHSKLASFKSIPPLAVKKLSLASFHSMTKGLLYILKINNFLKVELYTKLLAYWRRLLIIQIYSSFPLI